MSRDLASNIISPTIHRQENKLCLKVVIFTDLGQRQKLDKMLKIQQIFPKLYRCLLYFGFHNLEVKNAGLIDVKKGFKLKKIEGNFCTQKI